MFIVLCVFVAQGLVIEGFPAGQYKSNDGDTIAHSVDLIEPVSPRSIAENNGTVLVSEPDVLPETYENLQAAILDTSTISSENNEIKSAGLIETIISKPINLVDTILAEKVDKVNQTLTTVDEVVEATLEKVDEKIKQPLLTNASVTVKIDSVIHDLMELRSKMASELLTIKNTIESELDVIRKQIRSVILETKNLEKTLLNATDLLNESVITQPEKEIATNMEKEEPLVEPETEKDEPLLVEEEDIETQLGKINDYIEYELEKIDSFVESELALTETLIQAEVDRMNSFVKSNFKTADLLEPEVTDLESILESQVEVEIPIEGVSEFSGVVPASGRALIFGSTGYSPILPVWEENSEETAMEEVTQNAEVPVVDEEIFTETVPVYGRTLIFGSTGFLHPNLGPINTHSKKIAERIDTIPISVDSCPSTLGSPECEYTPIFNAIEIVSDTKAILDAGTPLDPILFREDNSEMVPVIGNTAFSGVVPAVGSVKIVGSIGYDPLFPLNPPEIDKAKPISESQTSHDNSDTNKILGENIALNVPRANDEVSRIDKMAVDNIVIEEKDDEKSVEVPVAGHAEFSGISRANGRTRITANFGCAPLLPIAETPNSKKYLWIADRPSPANAPPPVSRVSESTNKSDFPRNFPMISKFPPEFPETVIMDSTKNYERLIKDYEALGEQEVDHQGDVRVGEVFFEGKAPAYGTVSITGYSEF